MRNKYFKTFVAVFLIASVTYFTTPKANALFGFDLLNAAVQGIGHAITKVQSALHMGVDSVGHGGTIASVNVNTATDATGKVVQTGFQVASTNGDPVGAINKTTTVAAEASGTPCDGIEQAEQVAATADTAIINSFAVIAGSAATVGKLKARVVSLTLVQKCRIFQKKTLAASVPETANSTSGILVGKLQQLQAQIDALQARIDRLNELADASAKDFLRAILTKIALNLQKTITTKMVNGLIDHYKVSNYLQYADAVANQVYTIDYINDHFKGDTATALMVKSLATNSITENELQKVTNAFASNKAAQYAGLDCISGAALNDPNYYAIMARCGHAQSSPVYQGMVLGQQSQSARAKAEQRTAQEMADSKGFVPQRNCADSLSNVAKQDSNFIQLNNQLKNQYLVVRTLETQYNEAVRRQNKPDYERAGEALNEGYRQLQSIQTQLNNLPPAKLDQPLEKVCDAITRPASFIADTINEQIQSHLNEQGKITPDSLPGFLSRIADIASNLISGLITGGKPGSLLKEAGLQGIGIGSKEILKGINEARDKSSQETPNSGNSGQVIIQHNTRMFTYTTNGNHLTVNINIPNLVQFDHWQLQIDRAVVELNGRGRTGTYERDLDLSTSHDITIYAYDKDSQLVADYYQATGGDGTSGGGDEDPNCYETYPGECQEGNTSYRGSTGLVAGARTPIQIRGPQSVSFR